MEVVLNEHPDNIALHEIYYDEISYRLLHSGDVPHDEDEIGSFELKIGRSCIHIRDDLFRVRLGLTGYSKGEFSFTVFCNGIFTVPGDISNRNHLLGNSCIAILFPFVREKAMHLVNDDGKYDITIPPFSVIDAFKSSSDIEISECNE